MNDKQYVTCLQKALLDCMDALRGNSYELNDSSFAALIGMSASWWSRMKSGEIGSNVRQNTVIKIRDHLEEADYYSWADAIERSWNKDQDGTCEFGESDASDPNNNILPDASRSPGLDHPLVVRLSSLLAAISSDDPSGLLLEGSLRKLISGWEKGLQAEQKLNRGSYKNALANFDELQNRLETVPDPILSLQAWALRGVAYAQRYLGKPQDALESLTETLSLLEQASGAAPVLLLKMHDVSRLRLAIDKILDLADREEIREAIDIEELREIKGVFDKLQQVDWSYDNLLEIVRATILLEAGDFLRRMGKFEAAWNKYDEAENAFEGVTEDENEKRSQIIRGANLGRADAYRKKAAVNIYWGRAEEAQRLCKDSLIICEGHPNDIQMLSAERKGRQHLGWAESLLGLWMSSLHSHEKAMEILHEIEQTLENLDDQQVRVFKIDEAKSWWYYGHALQFAGELERAHAAYRTAREIIETLGQTPTSKALERERPDLVYGAILLGLGQVERQLARRDNNLAKHEATIRRYLNNSHDIHEQFGDQFHLARTEGEMGWLALDLGRFDKAERLFIKALERFELNLENKYYSAEMRLNLANVDLYRAVEDPSLYSKARQSARALLDSTDPARIEDVPDLRVPRIRALALRGVTAIATGDVPQAVEDYENAIRAADIHPLHNAQLIRQILDTLTFHSQILFHQGFQDHVAQFREKCSSWDVVLGDMGIKAHNVLTNWLDEFTTIS